MGKLSCCAKSKSETLISDKFYLHCVCANSRGPSSGWRSQAHSVPLGSPAGPVSASRTRFLSLPGHTSGRQPPRLTFPCPAPSCCCVVLCASPLWPHSVSQPPAESGRGSSGAVALLAPPLPGGLCFPHLSSFAPSSLPQRRLLFSKMYTVSEPSSGARSFSLVLVHKSSTDG